MLTQKVARSNFKIRAIYVSCGGGRDVGGRNVGGGRDVGGRNVGGRDVGGRNVGVGEMCR